MIRKIFVWVMLVLWLPGGALAQDIGAPAYKLAQQAQTTADNTGAQLRSQGWNIMSTVPMNPNDATSRAPTYNGVTYSGLTAVVQEVSPFSTNRIRFMNGWWQGSGLDGEAPASNDGQIAQSAVDPATGYVAVESYGSDGKLSKQQSRTIVVGDPIAFSVTAGVPYQTREYAGVTSSVGLVPTFNGFGFSSLYSQPNAADANGPEDSTQSAFTSANRTQSIVSWSHLGMLGYTGAAKVRTLACIGDSINGRGLHDGGAPYAGGGICLRVALGATTNVNVQWPVTNPNFGFIQLGHSGGRLVDFLANGGGTNTLLAASYASSVWGNFGINDTVTGVPLAQTKANLITLAVSVLKGCSKYIQQTPFPYVTSTDGGLTVAGQTVSAYESVRTGLASWEVDTSQSGFVAQVKAAYAPVANPSCPTPKVAVFNVSPCSEVNAAGVYTFNGGYWRTPTGPPAYTGSVTSGAGANNSFTDSAQTAAANTYKGYMVHWLTGANANTNASIQFSRSNGQIQTSGSQSTISVGDQYSIYYDLASKDLVHPSSYTYMTCAAQFPLSLVE